MDVIQFHNPDEYIAWVYAHQNDGYIAVRDGNEWRIHYADCDEYILGPIERGENLLAYPKYCSTNRENLRREAVANGGHPTEECNCQRYGTTHHRGRMR